MISAIIIDDEPSARDILSQTIQRCAPEVEILGLADSAENGIKLIKEKRPNVVFLDIDMPYQNGFELLDEMEGRDFSVVFTTAYDEYSIRAIRYSAFDYLLKPISPSELTNCIARLKDKIEDEPFSAEQFSLLKSMMTEGTVASKILIPKGQKMDIVLKADIIRLEGDRNYTWIYTNDGNRTLSSRTLKDFEEMLSKDGIFFRTFQSHIVNLNYASQYIKGRGGRLLLKDGSEIEVSRDRKKELLRRITM